MAFGLPKLDGVDLAKTVDEFLGLLRDINRKLDTLIELERARDV